MAIQLIHGSCTFWGIWIISHELSCGAQCVTVANCNPKINLIAIWDLRICLVRLFVGRNQARAPLELPGGAFSLLVDLIGG